MSIFSQTGMGDVEVARRWFGSHAVMYHHDVNNDGRRFEFKPNTPDYAHYIPKMCVLDDGTVVADLFNSPGGPVMLKRAHFKFDDYDSLPFRLEASQPGLTELVIGPEYVMTGSGIQVSKIQPVIDLTNLPSVTDYVMMSGFSDDAPVRKIICNRWIDVMHGIRFRNLGNVAEYEFNVRFRAVSDPILKKIEYDGDLSRIRVEGTGFTLSLPPVPREGERCFDDISNAIADGSLGDVVMDYRLRQLISRIQKTMPGVSAIDAGGAKNIYIQNGVWYYGVSDNITNKTLGMSQIAF